MLTMLDVLLGSVIYKTRLLKPPKPWSGVTAALAMSGRVKQIPLQSQATLWFPASVLCIWQATDFNNILDANPSKTRIFTCLPMNQMSILHAHGNQLAFHSALLRAKSINSKHRWPGWPTSAFLVCLTVFNAFSMVISMVSCRKSSNSSAVTTASKMCRIGAVLWY